MIDRSEEPENSEDDELLDRVAFDRALLGGEVLQDPENLQVDPEFARTVRLLHEVLGPNATPDSAATPPEGDDAAWELPTPFGRFEIIDRIGSGAFGSVWKAYDPALKRFVAIKALHPHLRLITTLRERFEFEAQAAARLNHTNIVRVYEVGGIHNISFLIS